MDARLTTADLVAMAAEHGIVLTTRQVERWRHQRLIPANARKGRGQGAGSSWLYEHDIGPRFLAAADLVVTRRIAISDAAVRLWIRGFGMEAYLLRWHLREATRPIRRLREKLAEADPEEAGHAIVEAVRRRPKKRAEWGMRDWSGPEQDGMAALAEDIVRGYVGPHRGLSPETVERSKTAMGITREADAKLAAAGTDMGHLLRTAFPKHAKLDEIAEDATDEELLTARAMCVAFGDRAQMEAALGAAGAPEAFTRKALDTGFDGAHGLLTAVAGLRWARSNGGGPA